MGGWTHGQTSLPFRVCQCFVSRKFFWVYPVRMVQNGTDTLSQAKPLIFRVTHIIWDVVSQRSAYHRRKESFFRCQPEVAGINCQVNVGRRELAFGFDPFAQNRITACSKADGNTCFLCKRRKNLLNPIVSGGVEIDNSFSLLWSCRDLRPIANSEKVAAKHS
ncbi:MAG: hypothetical protein DDT19_02694 [Syntrophomonadaceae bacterium]|nr:hypothetical protein [Bacillota bacterium]